MSRLHYAWAEISGKVFVTEDEIVDKLQEIYDERNEVSPSPLIQDADIDTCTMEDQQEAFRRAAHEKISRQCFPSDDPFKFNEIIVNMDTYNR